LGVLLTPIIKRKVMRLRDLSGRSLAVDANNVLYQFLALIRKPDGSLLTDSQGRVTSHLIGLLFRTTRLITDYGMKLAFVFDGKPPSLKGAELERRREVREKALAQWQDARKAGDYAKAFSKAVASSRLSRLMVEDAKRLLDLMGLPSVQAPSDAEAQGSHMASKGDVWGVNSQDYDSLLYGAPRLVRYITITGKEYLPSKGRSRRLLPELIELRSVLEDLQLSRSSLIDLAVLVGTDFNEGVRGIGPKKALTLVRRYGSIEAMPGDVLAKVTANLEQVRKTFLEPEVTDEYGLTFRRPDEEGLLEFLCRDRGFSPEKVRAVVKRINAASLRDQSSLATWMSGG
jgi:flap endonuclease-1